MSRRLVLAALIAAAAALILGAAVGRRLLLQAPAASQIRARVVVFQDQASGISLAYPASWKTLPVPGTDPDVALLVAAGSSLSLLVRVTRVGLSSVTMRTLPAVRKLTDDLVAADPRARLLGEPEAVDLGGLPGYRYRYGYASAKANGGQSGAHVHYFLFKGARLIQLVFQAAPAERLPALASTFARIAATFRGRI